MTGKDKSSGIEGLAPAHPPVRSGDAQAPGDDLTRMGSGSRDNGTVFDPGFADRLPRETLSETVFEPEPSLPPRPSEAGVGTPAGQDALLGAFDQIPYEAANPLLAAAAPLLLLLGDLRLLPGDRPLEPLRRHMANAVRGFERKAAESAIAEDDAHIARYVLCETVDDIVGALPGVDRSAWLNDGMLMRFFRAQTAGTGFYEALNAVLADPEPHCDLLELMHACLSLGFEGQYRGRGNGREALDRVRRDAYETLRYFRPRAGPGISPQWEGLGATLPRRRRLPLWLIAAAVPAIAGGVFLAMRTIVADRADAVVEQLSNLNPRDAAIIHRAAFIPQAHPSSAATPGPQPPPPAAPPAQPAPSGGQIERLRKELAGEIADGTLTIATKGDFVVVEIGNDVLFGSGAVQVKPAFNAIARDLTAALDKETGAIAVVGHTDSVKPGASSVFKSNYDLSVARAKAVKDILLRTIGDPSRLRIEGKGDQDPVADNANAEGRDRNRRIDILIRRAP